MYSTYNYPGYELPVVPQTYPYPFEEPDAKPKPKSKKTPAKPGIFNNQHNKLIC